ncbi:MAG TPA: hypothetical protein VGF55_24345 [Gemmataceae bacterium]
MFTILLDEQLTGYVGYIRSLAESDAWQPVAHLLGVRFLNFPAAGLAAGISDRDAWHFCQARRFYLLTDNRNRRGADSLEETIRRDNTPASLPVFTVSDRSRFANDRSYAERVIESLFDRLIDADNLIGTGRLYLP